MAGYKNHDYHVLPPSPWPLIGAASVIVAMVGAVYWFHGGPSWFMILGILAILYTMYGWWKDVVGESSAGDHTPVVQIGLRYGMVLFIISEVMFFVAWFWSFFAHAISPQGEIVGTEVVPGVWPPEGIETFDPWHLPFINTLILLCSGCAATWAHHALVHENDREQMKWGLWLAVGLGVVFLYFQAYEYSHAAFSFGGNIYGANFFMATGFHGFHVFIGTVFLAVCLFRVYRGHFTPERHVGFETAAWYWHFVDVVWLFLFFAIYVWGS